MSRKADKMFWEQGTLNNASFMQYYDRLVELSVSMFEWKNVPNTIDVRYLELALFTDGKAVFFEDKEIGYLALRCAIGGRLNVYQIPTDRRAYADNGYNMNLNEDNSVIIFNNYLHKNSMLDVMQFSRRLYNLDRTIDVNCNAQKTPVVIVCDEDERLTMKNLYQKYEGNEPFIFGDKSLNLNNIKVLSTGAPYVADKLYNLKTQLWNEALTYLGISNVNMVKKERLISDEVSRQQGGILANRYSRLDTRKMACEQINKMFGLNMDCEYKEDTRLVEDIYVQKEEKEGVQTI